MEDMTRGVTPVHLRWGIAIFSIAALAYVRTVGHGFLFDDDLSVVRNLYVRSIRSLPEIFLNTEWKGAGWENHLYRPLTTVTYAVNYAVSGLAPWSYHLVNVLLHATVSTLVFLLGLRWRLVLSAAGLGAVLFAVHPVHVEAVANVTGRKELLAAAFLLVMMLTHGPAVRRGGLRMAVPVAAYAAATLSKEIGAAGIILIAIQELTLREQAGESKSHRGRRRSLFGAYAVVLLGFLFLRSTVTGLFEVAVIPFVDNPVAAASPLVRWATGLAVLGKGLLLLLIPVRQSPDYSFDAIPAVETVVDPRFLLSVAFLIGWVVVGVRTRRRHPAVLLAGVWYGATILPAANLLFPIGVLFAERLLYVPSAGFVLLTSWAAWRLAGTWARPIVMTLTVLVLCAFGLATFRYAAAWNDPVTLFAWGARHQPGSSKVHQLLGASLLDEEPGQASGAFRRALEIWPDNYKALYGLYRSYAAIGREDLADSILAHVGPVLQATADENYTIGQMFRDAGRFEEAERRWEATVEVEPAHSGAWADLGTLALMRRDTSKARLRLERAVESDPTMASAWYNLGVVYRDLGAAKASRDAFRKFLETAGPDYADAREQVERWLREGPPAAN